MEITSQSETQLVVVCKPMYGMGLFGVLLVGLAWLILQSGNIPTEAILLIAALASLGFFLIKSTLTADKSSGTITIESHHITGLWRKKRTISLNDVISVTCVSVAARGASLIHLSLLLKDGEVSFGRTRPHYMHGIKSWLMSDGDTREREVAAKLAHFIGVDSDDV
jgi:hypothetical protein